jgi:hypothetical protein
MATSSSSEAPPPRTFSFAAAGWMQMYHFGVARAIQFCDLDTDPATTFAGSSAGAMAAAALAVGADFDELREYSTGQCSVPCRRSLAGAFNLKKYVSDGVYIFATANFAAQIDAAREAGDDTPRYVRSTRFSATTGLKACTQKRTAAEPMRAKLDRQLRIYTTTFAAASAFLPRAHCYAAYADADELEEAITVSCLLVPLAGMPVRIGGANEWAVDGGVTTFQPLKGKPGVVTVSGIYFSQADIKPSVYCPLSWCVYPPAEDEYNAVFALGYADALAFLEGAGIITAAAAEAARADGRRCLPVSKDVLGQATAQWTVADLLFCVFFFVVLRPLSFVLIYAEMLLVAAVATALAVLHDVLPTSIPLVTPIVGSRAARRRDGTRRAAWGDAYHALRNLVSLRNAAHVGVSGRVPVNGARLERYSLIYRLAQPFFGKPRQPAAEHSG